MNNNYLKSLDQLFDEKTDLSDESLKGFFNESLEFIQQLQTKLASSDEKVRQEALQTSQEMKDKLESQLKEICEKSGIDLEELASFAEDTSNRSPEEQQAIAEIESKFQAFKQENQ